MITRDQVVHAKPDPDLFLAAAAALEWTSRSGRRRGQRVGPARGSARGHARHRAAVRWVRQEELERAGAYRVYEEPADLLRHLDEIGVR